MLSLRSLTVAQAEHHCKRTFILYVCMRVKNVVTLYMATNVQVTKNNNESSANVIRRFTKRMQNAGIVRKVRSLRYHERIKSRNVQKEARLKKLTKKANYELLHKLGKVQDNRR